MGLLDRTWRVIRANVNSWIEQSEDPEKILQQAVSELIEEGTKMRQAVAHAIATQKRTERQLAQAQGVAQEWYRRAQLALDKNNEQLARDALTRRQSYQITINNLQKNLQQQRSIIDRLKKELRTLEGKISEAKMKKDLYVARARSASAAQRIHELTSNSNGGASLNAFERMEEKVLNLEAHAQATAELDSNELENQFSALETSNVDTELAALKAARIKGSQEK